MRNLRIVLFVIVAAAQLAVAGNAIVRSELALRTGELFRFRIYPVDPVDAFRGRYVAIRFAVDRAPVADDFEVRSSKFVFVPVEVDEEGYAVLGQARHEPPADGAYLRLRAGGVITEEDGTKTIWIALPFRRYYMDEDLAPEAERAVWSGRRGQREASVGVRIRLGVGVIDELYIDDLPIHQWLTENSGER